MEQPCRHVAEDSTELQTYTDKSKMKMKETQFWS
jgi:hypothetical protein